MPVMSRSSLHAWWLELRHSGLVVAPALLDEYFPQGPSVPSRASYQRLRERYAAFETWYQSDRAYQPGADSTLLYAWLDSVLDTFLEHDATRWQKGNRVAAAWKHETLMHEHLAPQRVLFCSSDQRLPALFVWVEQARQLGQGQGRAAYGKLLELLRAKNVKLGLLTNGRQFRLCYAGLDYDSWVEWDSEAWFAEEELRRQLYGFYTLLGPTGMNPPDPSSAEFPLLAAAEASRTRQGDLSTVLGEQVREAVELLLNAMNQAVQKRPALLEMVRRMPSGDMLSERRLLDALYQAAVRVIMRLVIILFAEARDMLPRSMAMYTGSYGLEGLYEQLRQAEQYEGRGALEERESAWARLLSLFSLIYEGSTIPDMAVPEYGGLLFRPGRHNDLDPIQRATALFESPDIAISDAAVLRLLAWLKNGRVKIRQGNHNSWANGPVDFSELRTEYIGLMYQGLLDFNLYRAARPMIFLNLGQEPVLPLELLEKMDDQHLKDLLKKLSVEKGRGPVGSEDEAGEGESGAQEDLEAVEEPVADGAEVEEEALDEGTPESETEEEATTQTESDIYRQRALAWAERAVEAGGLVKRPKGKKGQDIQYRYEKERRRQARRLIKGERVLEPGEFYLVQRGGTRKGSGTFYTRPQLAVPIARHTLEPLLHTTLPDGTRVPKEPEEILAIKVCDPACGSASFLVAALHYITDVLFQSLVYHRRIRQVPDEDQTVVTVLRRLTLPYGTPSKPDPGEELLPVRSNDEQLEPRTKARLRRYVVERCLYGVDLSPLAVELARMSLWIETMDSNMPFTFLDHKIRVGNALIGGWWDTYREYPIMAWLREGGDTGHSNGVHYHAGEWTTAIKGERNDVIKPELIQQIESSGPQLFLFSENRQQTPEGLHEQITTEMEQLHAMPVELAQEREERYRALLQRTDYQEMKRALDSWCASWFWPADRLDAVPTPATFYRPAPATRDLIDELAAELRFFHWEIEFPDVFRRPQHGFDAVVANPPWEIAKPYSKEFFSDYDPLYRTYGKQEALNEQRRLFQAGDTIEREWLLYQAYFKGMSNWAKHAASPFGDPAVDGMDRFTLKAGRAGSQLHALWRQRRTAYHSYADDSFPFRYQGAADLNTYKMFLEVAHHLLAPGGRLGMLVPSGIYTDQGSAPLRQLFLDDCRWEWLFNFINHRRIFDIDSRFKFNVVMLEKKRRTDTLRVAFNCEQLEDLEQPDNFMLDYPRRQVEHFSPKSLAIVEAQTRRDLAILDKLYTGTVLLGDQGSTSWQIDYATEFHMTNDSKLFPPLPTWEARGYHPDGYGRWVDPDGNVALPLYEGRMIGAFDPSEKGWVSGKGRGAVWRSIPFEHKVFEPQYLISFQDSQERIGRPGTSKISFMDIGSATNTRSMYASVIDNVPCGHTLSVFKIASKRLSDILMLSAALNSFTYDYALRCRLGGLHLSWFVLAETPLIPPSRLLPTPSAQLAARLDLVMPCFAPQWLELRAAYPELGEQHWRQLWAITRHERLRLRCILDAIIAELYGLDYGDFAWILRDDGARNNENPKGFWRVDDREPPELRHTTLALAAFKRLKDVGLAAFCAEDWQFPPEMAAQLGPRFTPWQEQGTIAESWGECEEHVRRMKEAPIPLPENDAGKRNGKNKKIIPQPTPVTLWDT
jgi:Eco57I restriction-modification methylase